MYCRSHTRPVPELSSKPVRSVAAIVYYVAGLIGYVAKAGKAGGFALHPDLVVGLAIPLVAIAVIVALRRARRRIDRAEAAKDPELE